MKLQGKGIEAFIARPDPKIRAVLVYGPDAGLVRDRADTLARSVVSDLVDPFRVSELTAKGVAGDPARLVDEVAALSLTGGRRLIRLREADDGVAAAFAGLFVAAVAGDSLVVAEAGDLGARSRLRLAFEAAAAGAALPCYMEDESALRRVMVELAAAAGLVLDPDAQAYLAANLVGDRLVARSEIEKLALYMDAGPGRGERRVGLEEVQAAVGDSASLLSLDDPAWAAASGDFPSLDRALVRLFAEGMAAVAVLRAAQRHFQRLFWVQAEIAAGMAGEAAVKALKPPVFFKMQAAFGAQLRQWPPAQLRQALERLVEAEAECKRTGMPDETLTARVLYQLAAMARARRSAA
ncbi:MAG: DNA polymerase III subunit delta [Rhodospirillaceae bacterium]